MDLESFLASMGVPPPNAAACENPNLKNTWLIIIIALAIIFFLSKDCFCSSPYANYSGSYCCKKKHGKGHHKHRYYSTMPYYEPFNYGSQNNIFPLILVVLFLLLLIQKRPNAIIV